MRRAYPPEYDDEIVQPRCSCGAFLKFKPDFTEPWEVVINDTVITFGEYRYWKCTRCGKLHQEFH